MQKYSKGLTYYSCTNSILRGEIKKKNRFDLCLRFSSCQLKSSFECIIYHNFYKTNNI